MKYNEAPKHWGVEDAHEGFRPDFWQGLNNECAIHAQFRILQDYGYTGTVDDLTQEAIDNGWFDPETGTASENIGKLLELHNVPCDMYFEANRYNLINELAQGKRVIVTVDSSELWHKNTFLEKSWENLKDLFGNGADHALVVSGINTEDPDNIKVVLTDSGDGSRTISYPIEQFEDAWRDGMCQMVVTKEPPLPELAFDAIHSGPRLWDMTNFDYAVGHVANIGDETFEEWLGNHASELSEGKVCDMDDAYFSAHMTPGEGTPDTDASDDSSHDELQSSEDEAMDDNAVETYECHGNETSDDDVSDSLDSELEV